jgi:hypothetical protein
MTNPSNSFLLHITAGEVPAQLLDLPTEKLFLPFFFTLLPFSQFGKADVIQRTAEQVEEASGTSWTCHNRWTQNMGLLHTCTLLELIQLQPSESATPPGKCNTSPVLKGTT